MIGHHYRRRIFETLDEQTNFIVDRRADRAARFRHAMRSEKILGSYEQRIRNVLIVDGIEKSHKANFVLVDLIMAMIDNGADAAKYFSLFIFGKEKRTGSMFVKWVFHFVDETHAVHFE